MLRAEDLPDDVLIVGQVVGSHGLRGEVKVHLETDFPDRLKRGRTVTVGDAIYRIRACRINGSAATLSLTGVDDRTAADALRGQFLVVAKNALPPLDEGRFYYYQLIGLQAVGTDGADYGVLVEIVATGANDVYVIRGEHGDMHIPAVDDVVLSVDLEAGRIVIAPLAGMVPEPKRPRRTPVRKPPLL
ncbi:MAG: ribosome maturation factor RimM [Dehalococcoidia bacterium]